jgi:hypothetical protein
VKLPNANLASVDPDNIVDYLLNPGHPDNGGKADFFTQLGFQRGRWEVLAAALKALTVSAEVTSASKTPHGKKYVITGRIHSPGGKSPLVQSIWIVDKNRNAARWVTAYPGKA